MRNKLHQPLQKTLKVLLKRRFRKQHLYIQNKLNFDKPQQYLTCKLFSNKQIALLFALKGKTVRGIRENFKNMYSDNTFCPVCQRCTDTQNHLIQCKVLQDIIPLPNEVHFSDMEGTLEQEMALIQTNEKYLALRDEPFTFNLSCVRCSLSPAVTCPTSF